MQGVDVSATLLPAKQILLDDDLADGVRELEPQCMGDLLEVIVVAAAGQHVELLFVVQAGEQQQHHCPDVVRDSST